MIDRYDVVNKVVTKCCRSLTVKTKRGLICRKCKKLIGLFDTVTIVEVK